MSSWDEMDELVREFLVESRENLDRLDQELLDLEKHSDSPETIASIFRTFHTVKGTCGFLGYAKLEGVAHAAESLLSRLRDGELAMTIEIASALLETVDAIREMLSAIETSGNDGNGEYGVLVELLNALQEGRPVGANATPAPLPAIAPASAPSAASTASDLPVNATLFTPPPSVLTPIVEARPAPAPPPPLEKPAASTGRGPEHETVTEHEQKATGNMADAYIRVDVNLLDKLMNLVGELVLARNQVLQFVPQIEDQAFMATTQRLNLITTELQSEVMKTRMQPIGNVWDKVPRLIRDLSLSLGKQVRVEMEGKQTELDKTLLEAIKDPLTHLVRNSVDHGIESPEDRLMVGKPAEGRLFLRAYHEGGQVNIEISDDGAGLDVERIRVKAREKGLITAEQAARMNDRDLQNLIFLPGFSTAKKITNVSGRGVGMDVVKTNIEKIGGVIDLQTRQGEGTTFRIKIPLTLAIIPALIVCSGGDRYAIPQISLLELVRLEGDEAQTGIELIHGTPVHRLRGNLLPLVDLNRELELEASARDVVNIVVLQADGRPFGLLVDSISDTEEIVVKPLGKHLKGISAFAGATIMGDGRVALILDVLGLATRAKLMGHVGDRAAAKRTTAETAVTAQKSSLLLFALADDRRMAIPLEMVSRLEVFPRRALEATGDGRVVQYRDELLPIVDLERVLGTGGSGFSASDDGEQTVHVVVHTVGDRQVGVAIERIVDIVEEHVVLKQTGQERRAGVRGCAVIQQRVTELIDLHELIQGAVPGGARGGGVF